MANKIQVKDLSVNSMIRFDKNPVRVVRLDSTGDSHYKRVTFEITNGIRIQHILNVDDSFDI